MSASMHAEAPRREAQVLRRVLVLAGLTLAASAAALAAASPASADDGQPPRAGLIGGVVKGVTAPVATLVQGVTHLRADDATEEPRRATRSRPEHAERPHPDRASSEPNGEKRPRLGQGPARTGRSAPSTPVGDLLDTTTDAVDRATGGTTAKPGPVGRIVDPVVQRAQPVIDAVDAVVGQLPLVSRVIGHVEHVVCEISPAVPSPDVAPVDAPDPPDAAPPAATSPVSGPIRAGPESEANMVAPPVPARDQLGVDVDGQGRVNRGGAKPSADDPDLTPWLNATHEAPGDEATTGGGGSAASAVLHTAAPVVALRMLGASRPGGATASSRTLSIAPSPA